MKPKHHYLMHIHEQYEEDGFYLDCFTHERKHQVIKGSAEPIKNKVAFEESILLTALNATYAQMADFTWNGLEGEARVVLGGTLSKRVRVQGVLIGSGDVVHHVSGRYFVRACFRDAAGLQLLASPMTFAGHVTPHSSLWNVEAEISKMLLHAIPRRARAWYFVKDECLLTLD